MHVKARVGGPAWKSYTTAPASECWGREWPMHGWVRTAARERTGSGEDSVGDLWAHFCGFVVLTGLLENWEW